MIRHENDAIAVMGVANEGKQLKNLPAPSARRLHFRDNFRGKNICIHDCLEMNDLTYAS
jgi:hypothetical protein